MNDEPKEDVGIVAVAPHGGYSYATVGSIDYVDAFFDAVAKLEGGTWGSRFPLIMNDLYRGMKPGIGFESIESLRMEIAQIVKELSHIPDPSMNSQTKTMARIAETPANLKDRFQPLLERLIDQADALNFYKGGRIGLMLGQDVGERITNQ